MVGLRYNKEKPAYYSVSISGNDSLTSTVVDDEDMYW